MDPLKPEMSEPRVTTNPAWNRSARSAWGSWRGLGLLAVAVLLPFGWLLPIARLAHARAAMRRRPDLRVR